MEMQNVDSSNILAAGYKDGTLRVRFSSGAEYDYHNVPEELGLGIFEAESVGKYFHGAIRSSFIGVKVEQ
jgi:hypothetical protein